MTRTPNDRQNNDLINSLADALEGGEDYDFLWSQILSKLNRCDELELQLAELKASSAGIETVPKDGS